MNTECKDCKLREGDCGHHHRFNGEVNCDIPSLSSCDKYGNCGYFQQKETSKGDLISREALKEDIDFQYICKCCHNVNGNVCDICAISEIEKKIDNATTVEYTFEEAFQKTICEQRLYCPERPQGKWIPQTNPDGFTYWKCSECNKESDFIPFNFCPNCGAKMKGGAE